MPTVTERSATVVSRDPLTLVLVHATRVGRDAFDDRCFGAVRS